MLRFWNNQYLQTGILFIDYQTTTKMFKLFFFRQCAIHFSSDSIPNGIGFGGRAHHFGLFISANFDQGHTFTCTTFGSPSLSKTQKIVPEVIECWGVAIKRPQDNQDRLQGTVLERFKEDRHMLNMVGIANSSQWCACVLSDLPEVEALVYFLLYLLLLLN